MCLRSVHAEKRAKLLMLKHGAHGARVLFRSKIGFIAVIADERGFSRQGRFTDAVKRQFGVTVETGVAS